MLNVLLNAKIKRYWKLLQNFCGNKSIKTVIAKLFVNRIVSVLSKSLKKITFAKVKKYYKNQKPLNKHSNNKL